MAMMERLIHSDRLPYRYHCRSFYMAFSTCNRSKFSLRSDPFCMTCNTLNMKTFNELFRGVLISFKTLKEKCHLVILNFVTFLAVFVYFFKSISMYFMREQNRRPVKISIFFHAVEFYNISPGFGIIPRSVLCNTSNCLNL